MKSTKYLSQPSAGNTDRLGPALVVINNTYLGLRMRIYLVLLSLAFLQQEGRARPESAGCNSPEALRVAEEALEQVNQDRTHGYVLSLDRLYDISHTAEKVRTNTHSSRMHVSQEGQIKMYRRTGQIPKMFGMVCG